MTGLAMRAARVDDLPAIVALIADDEHASGGDDPALPLDPRYLEAFRLLDEAPNQLLAVAERDGRLVGTLQLSFLPGLSHHGAWRGHIEAVKIASDLRGQGLGSQMIDWALNRCRERGCGMAQLMSSQLRVDAHRFYERLGWEKSHYGFKIKLT